MTLILIMTLCAVALTEIVRRLPKIETWSMTGVRPWSCNACMSFWSSLTVWGALALIMWSIPHRPDLFSFGATVGLTYLLLSWDATNFPAGGPPPPI